VRVLFDTSILVAAIVEAHPFHSKALPWLSRARTGEVDACVASHSLAELYSILTAFPIKPKISPREALQLIRENVEATARRIDLDSADYASTLDTVVQLGLSGGVVYDALIARAAELAKVDLLLTLNAKDFRRIWPESTERILSPLDS
jgi:predicted nucleic acid-binding protein